MELDGLFERLLAIGRSDTFDAIARILGVDTHHNVLRLADQHRHRLVNYVEGLQPSDRQVFIKSIAMLEHGVGGLGSVTTLQYLLPANRKRSARFSRQSACAGRNWSRIPVSK